MPEFDTQDQAMLAIRLARRQLLPGPLAGDICIMSNGERRRFTYDWGVDGLQLTDEPMVTYAGPSTSSFYLTDEGYADYSGGMTYVIARSRIEDTRDTADAPFWFFHHNRVQGSNGVYFHAPVRVWRIVR